MEKEIKDEDFVDQLLKWYGKGIKNGTIKPPENGATPLADKALELWRAKQKQEVVAKPERIEEPQMAVETTGFSCGP